MLTQENIQTTNGSKLIVDTLKKLSVDTIFGYPGGVILGIYDELYKQSEIKHILTRHEQAAVHSADGYARISGKCGVVLVTSGPGATNTVTGIMNAYLDGTPLVILTGQVSSELLGRNSFQEANICDITKSCTKACFQIKSVSEITSILKQAFKTAMEGKKGPVVVDIVKDVLFQKSNFSSENELISISNFSKNIIKNSDIKRIYNRINNSQKPVIICGGGIHFSECYDELLNFANKLDVPIVSSMMGLGGISSDNKNYFGMVGIFGDNCANELIRQSDLIISFGCRFNDRITDKFKDIDLKSKTILIDLDKNLISSMLPSDFIIGDIKEVLDELNLEISDVAIKKFTNWKNNANNLRQLNFSKEKISNQCHTFEVFEKLQEFTKDMDVIFTSEVGQHQLFAVKNLCFNKNRRILVSGGSGTMGFGLPAAIGASIAQKDKCVICISGDGSFQMSLEELAVCKDLGLNIKIIIINNGYLGMVRQLQEFQCDRRYSQTKISSPDFVKLAQSYGLEGLKVKSSVEIEKAFQKAFSTDSTFILDINVESMEVVK